MHSLLVYSDMVAAITLMLGSCSIILRELCHQNMTNPIGCSIPNQTFNSSSPEHYHPGNKLLFCSQVEEGLIQRYKVLAKGTYSGDTVDMEYCIDDHRVDNIATTTATTEIPNILCDIILSN